jgi:hypothetical protein
MKGRVRFTAGLGRADTSNGCEHDEGTWIEPHWLANSARWRFSRKVLSEDLVETLYKFHVEEVELHEQYVGIGATGFTQQRTQVSHGLMHLFVKRWLHLARFR